MYHPMMTQTGRNNSETSADKRITIRQYFTVKKTLLKPVLAVHRGMTRFNRSLEMLLSLTVAIHLCNYV
jgi:hypothetical protein